MPALAKALFVESALYMSVAVGTSTTKNETFFAPTCFATAIGSVTVCTPGS